MTDPMDVDSNKFQWLEAKINAQLHAGDQDFKNDDEDQEMMITSSNQEDDSDFAYYNEVLKDLTNRSIKQGKNLSVLLIDLMILVSLKSDNAAMEKFQVLETSLKRVSQSEDYGEVYNKFIELFQAVGTIMSRNNGIQSKKRKAEELDWRVFQEDEIDEPILEFVKEISRLRLLWTHLQVQNSSTLATLKNAILPVLRNVENCEKAMKLLQMRVKGLEEKYENDEYEFENMKLSDVYKEMVSKINEFWDQM